MAMTNAARGSHSRREGPQHAAFARRANEWTSIREFATTAECLDSMRIRDTITERRQRAQEGLHRAGLLPGGQGGRGELAAGGTPLTFDHGKT